MAIDQTIERLQVAEGLGEQAELLRDGARTSRQLTEQTLQRIEATQGSLNTCKLVLHEEALAAADDADRKLEAGQQLPLLGVPIAVKDDMAIAGHPTAFGCAGDFPPQAEDGELARRLRKAGAVIVAKTNTPEIGQWSVTAGPAFGVTRNPWNTDHTPGGSSGGASAAVAAGVMAAAVGSDGAGSVRIPAAWTNLVGIKPTRGRVSSWPDLEAFNGITAIGPLARTVGDAALLLDAITGNNPNDMHKLPLPERAFALDAEDQPGRLRIALSFRIPFSGVPAKLDTSVRRRIEATAELLASLGHDVHRADPAYSQIGINFLPRSTNGVAEWADRAPDRTLLDHRTIDNARTGRLLGGRVLKTARTLEPLMRRRIGRIFRDFDVVLTPTTAKPPLRADAINGLKSWATDRMIVGSCPYAWAWNAIGWPGISVPAGFVDGLPVGAQLLGPRASEPLLIKLAAQLERELNWQDQRPPSFF